MHVEVLRSSPPASVVKEEAPLSDRIEAARVRAAEARVELDVLNVGAREKRCKWQWYFLMGAVGYLKGEAPPGAAAGGEGAASEAEGLQRGAEDKTAVKARWEMVRKLLLATEAHRKREGQKEKRQQVKARLRQAQAEELVCSRLLRAMLKELEEAPTVYAPARTRAHT